MIDLVEIGEICKKHNALFHSDTVQTMGNVAFDLHNTNVHYITGAAHKFYGPKGVGFMYVKNGFNIPAHIHGGSQERNMRAGTENVAGIVGMGFALNKCHAHLAEKEEKLWTLKAYMRELLTQNIPSVEFNGAQERGKALSGVLNVVFPCGEDSMLIFNLDIQGISASGGSACTSGSNIGSHVLAGIGLEPIKAANSVRFSFGVQNTKEEIEYVVEKLKEIITVNS
jgi:cysteine desulfurase